eukprot:3038886-Karenia_brevis.AAC.1
MDQVLSCSGSGIVRACADDVALATSSLNDLIPIARIFDTCEGLSGLTLGASKCVLIPSNRKCSAQTCENLRCWLECHIPKWSTFAVEGSAEYLGIQIGPTAAAEQWSKT